jgi:DNA-binding beta-propeller fold protein YncE
MRASAPLLAAMLTATAALPAAAAGTGMVFVTNERGNTITVLNPAHEIVETIETCARPRGIHFSADRSRFFVGCADDDQIAIYDVASRALVGRITGVEEPETFDLHPDGRHLYVSNEEDATATVYDVETGELVGEYETGEESVKRVKA